MKKNLPQEAVFTFWLMMIIGFFSNCAYALYVRCNIKLILMILILTACIAAIIAAPVVCLKKKYFIYPYIGTATMMVLAFLVSDYFILINFSKVINSDIVDILFSSNIEEMQEFVITYLTSSKVLQYVVALCIFVTCSVYLAKIMSNKRWVNIIGLMLATMGLCLWSYAAYGFVVYRNGQSIPQLTTLSRSLYSAYVTSARLKQIDKIADICQDYIANNHQQSDNNGIIICLVIGESHSVFHTNAYGYEKITFPHLLEISESDDMGQLVWYTDMITIADHTHTAMESIFSMSRHENFDSTILLPACFKALGYTTALYDNQYLVNKSVSFLNNRRLSDLLFDFRNGNTMRDEDLPMPTTGGGNKLLIYHLMGSHYTYSSRYPHEKFTVFTPSDYPLEESEDHRSIMAHYDNSLVYTDYILYSIIKQLKDAMSVVVYVSDHGEEVYEQGDFIGHGNAAFQPKVDYQIRVPMFIWLSNDYIATFPHIANNVTSHVGTACISDDIGHLLINLANEKNDLFDKTRSVINDEYVISQRIVLNSINFDN